jgi:CheY-like chemotaxis protein
MDEPVRYLDLETAVARGLHVLVVEDHPVNRQILTLMLERLPARVTCADDGLQGVSAFEQDAFDVILMDLRMPLMDGYESMRRIREIEAARSLPRTPIIVISAHTTPSDVQRARDAGADHHLGKPVHIPTLLETMDTVMQDRAARSLSAAPPERRSARRVREQG